MESSPTESPLPSKAFELGLHDVPARFTQLAPSMIYAVALGQQGLRLALIGETLRRAVVSGRTAAVVTPQEPQQFLRKIALAGPALEAYRTSEMLQVVGSGGNGAISSIVGGSRRRVLHDLQALVIADGSLIVLDHADDRFSLNEPATARSIALAVQEWVDQHQHTLLVTFAAAPDDPVNGQGLIHVAETLAGFASARQIEDVDILDVQHWFGSLGAMAHSSFTLEIGEQGRISGRPTYARDSIDPKREFKLVTQRAGLDFPADDATWVRAESLMDVVAKARRLVGGSIVLHFDRDTSLRELAQTIALLRAVPRPQLRIIVRECEARLRVAQIAALLRVGMNMIIPNGIDSVAAQAMVEALRGSLSSRPTDIDVDPLLAQVDQPARPLPVDEFRERAIDMLREAQDLEVPSCLTRFSVVSPHAMRAVTAALSRGRNLLFTEHDGAVWVMFYGCLPERVTSVLGRLLGARFGSLLEDFQLAGEQGEILRSVRLLRHAAVSSSDAVFEDTVIRSDATPAPDLRASSPS